MELGDKLIAVRMKNNLSVTEFAESISVSKSTLRRWENNSTIPPVSVIQNICEKYHITPEAFFETDNKVDTEAKVLENIYKETFIIDKMQFYQTLSEYFLMMCFMVITLHMWWLGLPLAILNFTWAIKTRKHFFFVLLTLLMFYISCRYLYYEILVHYF